MTDNEIKCDTVINDLYGVLDDLNSGFAADTIEAAIELINRQRAEIKRLEIELKAMRGAANSFKADVKRLQEAEAKRMLESAPPLVIRNNKIPAQELAEMINLGVISTDIEDAEIETMAFDIDDIVASMKNEPNYVKEVTENIIAKAEGLNVTTDQLECFLNKMVAGEEK